MPKPSPTHLPLTSTRDFLCLELHVIPFESAVKYCAFQVLFIIQHTATLKFVLQVIGLRLLLDVVLLVHV